MNGGLQGESGQTTIRVRMGLVLAAALLPILILGVLQSSIAFRQDAEDRRTNLAFAAERSAASAAARLESATILLNTLTPSAIGAGLRAAPSPAHGLATPASPT